MPEAYKYAEGTQTPWGLLHTPSHEATARLTPPLAGPVLGSQIQTGCGFQ